MEFYKVAVVSRATMMAMAAIGVFWGGFASMLPDIKAGVGASDGEMGLVLLMSALGGAGSLWLAPGLERHLGRFALPALGCLLCLALFPPVLAGSVPALGGALFVMGASVALVDITTNVRISALETRHKLHLMNANHAMFSFAFGISALMVGFARKGGWGPDGTVPLLFVICLVLVALTWEKAPLASEIPTGTDAAQALDWTPVLLTALVLGASFIGENATEAWSALFVERGLGGAPGQGSLGPALLGIGMGIGRLSGQAVASRLGEARLITGSAILGCLGALIIAAAGSLGMALAGIALLSLGLAVIVPSVNSILGRQVADRHRALALSRAWMVGVLGFFIGPAMMGGLAELFGLRAAFGAVALIVALIVPAIRALARRETGA